MANRPNGTLYVGVTTDFVRHAWEHRMRSVERFTNHLVDFEGHEEIGSAITRERAMNHWSRPWKINVLLAANPYWVDLDDRLA